MAKTCKVTKKLTIGENIYAKDAVKIFSDEIATKYSHSLKEVPAIDLDKSKSKKKV